VEPFQTFFEADVRGHAGAAFVKRLLSQHGH